MKIIKDIWPVLIVAAGLVAWGSRLENLVAFQARDIAILQERQATNDNRYSDLKIEQTKIQGKIETILQVMDRIQITLDRIEGKINEKR